MESSNRGGRRSVKLFNRGVVRLTRRDLFSVPSASADEIRFASRRDWQAWPLPGTVELTPQGGLKPIAARRNINAALNASAFGGGIRRAGSNLRDCAVGHGWRPLHRLVIHIWTIPPKAGILRSIWAGASPLVASS